MGVSDLVPLPPQYLLGHCFLSRSLPQICISDLLPTDFVDAPQTGVEECLYLLLHRLCCPPCYTSVEQDWLHIGVEDAEFGSHADSSRCPDVFEQYLFTHLAYTIDPYEYPMDLCTHNKLCLSGRPSCMAKTLMTDITRKHWNQIFFIPWQAPLTATISYHFHWPWSCLGLQGQPKAKALGFVFSHTLISIMMKFDTMLKQFGLNNMALLWMRSSETRVITAVLLTTSNLTLSSIRTFINRFGTNWK